MKGSSIAMAVAMAFVGSSEAMSDRLLPELPKNAHSTEVFLSKRIPNGTPLAQAEHEMQTLGFKCTPGTDGPFGRAAAGTYVYCDRLSRAIVAERHQVALVHSGGRISVIYATYGLIGP
jgi:hypothetical protein